MDPDDSVDVTTPVSGVSDPAPRTHGARLKELNDTVRYTMWSVFSAKAPLGLVRDPYLHELHQLIARAEEEDVVVRGVYDLSGMRADADFMVWSHAPTIDALQSFYSALRRSALGRALHPVWSTTALHRPAEFNKSHIPAFLAGSEPQEYICVYPFVRSYEWYLLPDEERRALLTEHGKMAREYPDVRTNTVASFALGDYEWMLAFEAAELHRIVDLMRHLRASGARRHVREEVPFFTGRRRSLAEIVVGLP
jgi:chlorite dismutase